MTPDDAGLTVTQVSLDRTNFLGQPIDHSPAMSYRLELIAVPVSDVARAVAFYEQVGFRVTEDRALHDGIRFVSMSPVGSACSIAVGDGIVSSQPGSLRGLVLFVDDIDAAQDDLRGRGIEVTSVQRYPIGQFVFFSDPDGNRWEVCQPETRPATG